MTFMTFKGFTGRVCYGVRSPSEVAPKGYYYVDDGGAWFVIRCSTQRIARSWGVSEFGPRQVRVVRRATMGELDLYRSQKGITDEMLVEDYPND